MASNCICSARSPAILQSGWRAEFTQQHTTYIDCEALRACKTRSSKVVVCKCSGKVVISVALFIGVRQDAKDGDGEVCTPNTKSGKAEFYAPIHSPHKLCTGCPSNMKFPSVVIRGNKWLRLFMFHLVAFQLLALRYKVGVSIILEDKPQFWFSALPRHKANCTNHRPRPS
jgi:hypothetical protein